LKVEIASSVIFIALFYITGFIDAKNSRLEDKNKNAFI
jgi:hypothetical protein